MLTIGSQLSPKVGPAGQSVTLSGHNFDKTPVSVLFGSTPAPIPVGTVLSYSTIVVPAPVATSGSYKINVTTAGGTVVSDASLLLWQARI